MNISRNVLRCTDDRLKLATKIIYSYLAEAQGGAGHVDVSLADVASECGLCKKTAQRSVKTLKNLGLLDIHYRKEDGDTSIYFVKPFTSMKAKTNHEATK